jgi:hypothetical protein
MKQLTMEQLTINNEQMNNRIGVSKGCSLFIVSLLIFALAGCITPPPEPTAVPTIKPTATPVPSSPLTEAFPGADVVAGWTPDGGLEVYDSETIFSLVNGQADFFFVYGFEQVAVRRYKNAEDVLLDIHIWQVAEPEGAYGLFSVSVAGEPADIGNEGDTDPGRRIIFWQDRYVAQLFSRKTIPDADLRAFAESVSAALPAGGERPALIDRLPSEGMTPRSALFFYEELSIQNEVWLGGENLLGLSRETDGVIARYELDGAVVRLMLIEYPDAGATSAGLAGLEGGEIDDLAVVGVQGNLLGAVFGQADEASVRALLEAALE